MGLISADGWPSESLQREFNPVRWARFVEGASLRESSLDRRCGHSLTDTASDLRRSRRRFTGSWDGGRRQATTGCLFDDSALRDATNPVAPGTRASFRPVGTIVWNFSARPAERPVARDVRLVPCWSNSMSLKARTGRPRTSLSSIEGVSQVDPAQGTPVALGVVGVLTRARVDPLRVFLGVHRL